MLCDHFLLICTTTQLTCSRHGYGSTTILQCDYEWSTGETSDSITLDGSLNPTDTVMCTATLSDGMNPSVQESVTLENRAPELAMLIDADGQFGTVQL